jgi:putative hydrolase of the HAD superfamily
MNRAIFWDFDGTITYSSPLWRTAVFNAVSPYAAQYGITFDNLRPHLQHGFPWHEWNTDSVLKDDAWWAYMFRKFNLLFQSYGLDEARAGMASKEVRNIVLNPANYKVYEDAISTLEACVRKGYKNYILSNNYPELENVIRKLELSKYFDEYIVSGVIGYNKPRQEIFKYGLKLANYPDISYMIGDNPKADIDGAFNAGMKTILVHNSAESRADYSPKNLFDIVDLL